MTLIFLLIISMLALVSYIRAKSFYNLFTLLAVPYVAIVLINGCVMNPLFSFFTIRDEVLMMLFWALIAFFIGAYPLSKQNQLLNQLTLESKYERYNMQAMIVFVFACGLVATVWSFWDLTKGASSLDLLEEGGAKLSSGLVAHIKIMASSLAPITFSYGLKRKNVPALFGTGLLLFAVFLTFTKYNIICAVLAIVIYYGLNEPQESHKVLIAFVLLPLALFVGNYLVSFTLRGTLMNVDGSFYINHLWSYVGGSVIYDNYIFEPGIRVGVDIIDKLMTFLFAFPNMFISRLTGVRLFPHQAQSFRYISTSKETSNVTDAIGYLYPSHGGPVEVVVFTIFMIILGFCMSIAFRLMLERTNYHLDTTLSFFLSEFVIMSFFGTFYINPGPWEQLLFCAAMPTLFTRSNINTVVRIGVRRVHPRSKVCVPNRSASHSADVLGGKSYV